MSARQNTPIIVIVMAHNEERRIAACLASLPLGREDVAVHVVVNGSSDRTAEMARGFAVTVHDWPEGGKSRSWNRIVLDTPGIDGNTWVFVDGDAEIVPGSIDALAQTLADHPEANAASGLPANGRRVEHYRRELTATRGLFGDLYALRGSFVDRLRTSGIRLPDDLIGDDSLIGALAKTGLRDESDWQETRIEPCPQAGFLCEPVSLTSPTALRMQYKRMINYAVRHWQNAMVTTIMRSSGPQGLPRRMATLYPPHLATIRPRAHPLWWWFDRQAIKRMRQAAAPSCP